MKHSNCNVIESLNTSPDEDISRAENLWEEKRRAKIEKRRTKNQEPRTRNEAFEPWDEN